MRIIYDFEIAKSSLTRGPALESYRATPEMKRRIKSLFGAELTVEQVVERIIYDVRTRGDDALLDYTQRIDGVKLSRLEVDKAEVEEAYRRVDQGLISALQLAADRVRGFHLMQKKRAGAGFIKDGLGQLVHSIERVGVYVPGGTACYPSTVLMIAIPARVAGVSQVILTTPAGVDGVVPPPTLVAADIAGASRIFKVGGAQAIAALAFGTHSLPKVDKICGPGNIFVMLAKKEVYGVVDIDGLAGPTETIVVADEKANPVFCALDLLAQAEHDALASAIMITTSSKLAKEVAEEVERRLAGLERGSIAAASLEANGRLVVVDDMDRAIELVNLYAPEHVSLMVSEPDKYIAEIRNAGGIFLGEGSSESLGDYIAGPSHVMPTGGTARFSSPLGIWDFIKYSSVVSLSDDVSRTLAPAAAKIARAEGLTAHAQALEARLKTE